MKFNKVSMFLLVVVVYCVLLGAAPVTANPVPGKGAPKTSLKSNTKKQDAPRHSLGTGARTALVGGGVAGGVLTSLF
ncbi:uncharacterized protein LOC131269200 [Anopheles coustani]|uniref:uncharacterized protein LOC131269200 n=1 Tax=Anopheles coustani TaxID=139045 RepID=UPI00265856ED|nr:uncharacterized protein LOC131269200 [Anopheles coustani]